MNGMSIRLHCILMRSDAIGCTLQEEEEEEEEEEEAKDCHCQSILGVSIVSQQVAHHVTALFVWTTCCFVRLDNLLSSKKDMSTECIT